MPKKMSAEDAALMAEAAAAQQRDDDDMDMEEEEEVQMKIVRNYKRPDQAGAGAATAAEAAGCVLSTSRLPSLFSVASLSAVELPTHIPIYTIRSSRLQTQCVTGLVHRDVHTAQAKR